MTGRDYALMALGQREVAEQLDALGYSPRIICGAILDAGGLGAYATIKDYKLALGCFADARRRHARWRLPGLDVPAA